MGFEVQKGTLKALPPQFDAMQFGDVTCCYDGLLYICINVLFIKLMLLYLTSALKFAIFVPV